MIAEQWQRLQALFAEAVILPQDQRAEFLERNCGNDSPLLQRLQRLINVDARLQGTTARTPVAGLHAWVAKLEPVASLQGMLIGPYCLCEALGQGGMGSVYRAERVDGNVQQQVAVKFVRRELLDTNLLRRFELERQTLAALDHPNIARLIDAAALPNGTPYFVMDYVAGIPVTDYCARAQLNLQARLRLFGAVCAAVSHAHRNLVVHRDLKPGNILVTEQGVPKLLDFGIAKSLDTPTAALNEQTGTGQRFFSPRYAAPEQLLGKPITVGCDIYALGLLLYELLAGVGPFDLEGLSAGQIERLVTAVPAPAPSERSLKANVGAGIAARSLRGDLDGIVLRCLRKARTERYASVEQLEDDLQRYLLGLPINARNGHGWYRLRKFVARHQWAVMFGAVASVTLALAIFALWRQNQALRHERDLSKQSLAIFQDAFASADPIRAAGAQVNAGQILESARARIDGVYEQQPALFAALAESIGEVDLSLGRSREAITLMQRATSAAKRSGADAKTVQRLLIMQARALTSDEQFDAATQRLVEARALSDDAPLEWKLARGRVLSMTGQSEQGIALLRESVAEITTLPPNAETANVARRTLAEALRIAGDDPGELEVLDATLSWQRSGLAPAHPQITRTRMRRVVSLRANGRNQESLEEALAVVDEIDQTYGPDTPTAAFAHNALGRTLDALGRNNEAIAAYRTALEIWQRAWGHDHPSSLTAMFNLAYTLQLDPHGIVESERLYRSLLTLTGNRLGIDSEIAVYYRLYFGKMLRDSGRVVDALQVLTVAEVRKGLETSSAENRRNYLDVVAALLETLGCPLTARAAQSETATSTLCDQGMGWLELRKADFMPMP